VAAIRLVFTWLGTRKTLTSEQKHQAASTFDADQTAITASKRLLDAKHPAMAAVNRIRSRATKFWKDHSLPFPEPGIRLIRHDAIEQFDRQINEFRTELDNSVQELEQHYQEMRDAARERLGTLYNASDYPVTLIGAFGIEHSFPAIEAPDYLRQLNPAVYEQECQRVQAQFSEAVALTEQMFFDQLSGLVDHLVDRMSGTEDGRPKAFRDSTIDNLNEFFSRFRRLNVVGNEELEQLVKRARRVVRGIKPQQLRDNSSLRQHVASQMSTVQATLDGLMVDRPRRNIVRRPR